jgi:hypothetical protein
MEREFVLRMAFEVRRSIPPILGIAEILRRSEKMMNDLRQEKLYAV